MARQRLYVVCPSSNLQTRQVGFRAYGLDRNHNLSDFPYALHPLSEGSRPITDGYDLVADLITYDSDVYLVDNLPDGSNQQDGQYQFVWLYYSAGNTFHNPLEDSALLSDELPFSNQSVV